MRKQVKVVKILFSVLLLVFSFSVQDTGKAGNLTYLTNFYIINAGIGDVFQGLAKMGDVFLLMEHRTAGGPPVNIRLRDGIEVAEAFEALARIYGYSCRWQPSARTVIVGDAQTFQDYESIETRIYDPGSLPPEEFVETLTALFPRDRLAVEPAGGKLEIRTSILEHRLIAETIEHLNCSAQAGVTVEISVQEVKLTTCRTLGIKTVSALTPAASAPQFLRIGRRQIESLTEKPGEVETFRFFAAGKAESRRFFGDLLPVVVTEARGTRIDYQRIGATLAVTPLAYDDNVTLLLSTEVYQVKGWEQAAGGGTVPVVETVKAGTVVRLKEGESVVICGLNLAGSGEEQAGAGQPVDFPLLGKFFSSRQGLPGEKTELCIFITPHPRKALSEKAPAEDRFTRPAEETPVVIKKEETGVIPEEESGVDGESPEPEKSMPLWEVDVVELGTPGKATTAPPVPESGPKVPEQTAESPGERENGQKPAEPVGLMITYKVKKGDTIAGIAGKYGIPATTILHANNLPSSPSLSVGLELVIPIPLAHLYPLKAGETLWRLAQRYGVTVQLLMEINQISEVTQLSTGQIIILPVPVAQVVGENSK